jgi:two-component system, NtrC family, response regulator HydG
MTAQGVLIVDDEAANGQMLVESLDEAGWEASAATGMAEAIALLQSGRYGVIVSDIRMDDGDGFDLLRAVLTGASPVPVILMSSFGNEDTLRRALAAGAFAYLAKPFELERLLPLLERAQRATVRS